MKAPTAMVAGVVALVAIAVAGVVILTMGVTSDNTKWLAGQMMFGAIMTLIPVIIGAFKADKAAEKAEQAAARTEVMHEELKNGLIPEKVQEAVNAMANDPENPSVTITPPTND